MASPNGRQDPQDLLNSTENVSAHTTNLSGWSSAVIIESTDDHGKLRAKDYSRNIDSFRVNDDDVEVLKLRLASAEQ